MLTPELSTRPFSKKKPFVIFSLHHLFHFFLFPISVSVTLPRRPLTAMTTCTRGTRVSLSHTVTLIVQM